MAGVSGAISNFLRLCPLWDPAGEDLAIFKLARVGGKIAILGGPPTTLAAPGLLWGDHLVTMGAHRKQWGAVWH